MSNSEGLHLSRAWLVGLGIALVIVAALAGWLSARIPAGPAADLSSGERQAIEVVVRDYLLENPEVIPEAMENLQRKANSEQLSAIRSEVETPYPGAILGNPNGSVTLVEFSDFACGYCRRSVDDIKVLLKQKPQLRIVLRELPILSEQSAAAARMALAAAEQGKYDAFYHAMFAAGRPGPETIDAAARKSGIDMKKARAAIKSPRIEAEIARNLDMARQLGFNGTPSWVAGDELISGAVGAKQLAKILRDAQS
ncbi:MAG: DsbA family protein [Sphingomonadaceae bacterium]|nr:DsbA family protein [Sphingomonadaceae bacterium]